MAYGRTVIGGIARSLQVTADGTPKMKAGGVTIDWSTVAAVSGSDVTLNDGTVVPVGAKYLRYGQVITLITASSKYGPYDVSPVNDGRQTLARGKCFILNETVVNDDPKSDHPPVLDGGRVWKGRLIMTTGTASLTAGPTVANFEAAFPQISYAEDAN